ncbi:hypothetical protein WMF38_28945 [Sorangium sp. So ce118]
MAESLLGAGEGLGELTVGLGRPLVLGALTFGAYGAGPGAWHESAAGTMAFY